MHAVLDPGVHESQPAALLHPPFFIVGAQRSGTTLLRLMMNGHSSFSVPFESGFITTFFHRLGEYGDLLRRDNAIRLLADIAAFPLMGYGQWMKDPDTILAQPIRNYSDLVHAIFLTEARSKGKFRWGDKTPSYVSDLDVLWQLFPGCRILHLIRDGRDVVQSLRHIEWGFRNLPRAASDWSWKVTLGRKMGTLLGSHYREVRYEDLVAQPEGTLREVCSFLDVAYEPAMLKYTATGERELPSIALQWHRNSIRDPDPSLAFAWKRSMSRSDRIVFEQVAGDTLELLGYERERLPNSLGSRLKNLYYANVSRW